MSNTKKETGITLFSLKLFFVVVIGILLFVLYINILIYGENSLTVLDELQKEKKALIVQEKALKIENQRLQKEYFELKQLEPKE